ncbi:MAG: hypothetical protein ACNA8W_17235 [Bradymonadaceae bacterium]
MMVASVKIANSTSDELRLVHRPWGFVVLALPFLLIAAGSMLVGAKTTELECERGGMCSLVHGSLLFHGEEVFPTDSLTGASVEKGPSREGKPTFRVVLNVDGRTIPYTEGFTTSVEGNERQLAEINDHVKDSGPAVWQVRRSDLREVLLFAAIPFAVIGLGFLITLGAFVRIVVSGPKRKATISVRRLVWSSTRSIDLEGGKAIIEEKATSDSRSSRICIVKPSGERVPLTGWVFWMRGSYKVALEIVEKINGLISANQGGEQGEW